MRELHKYGVRKSYEKGKIEKQFMADIHSGMRSQGYFCHHIADVGLGYRFLDSICIAPDGKMFAIEFKKVVGLTFNMSQFEGNQIVILETMLKRNTETYILIYSQKTGTYIQTTYKYLKENANDKGGIKLF